MKAIEPAREAVRLLTVVPVGSSAEPAAPAAAVAWYAPVGLAMGGALALAAFVAWEAFPAMLAAVAVVACWAALTGMLHLDGLADTADAALAPVSRERRLVIARDVAHGTFAVVAVALVLAMKAAALAGMPRDAAAAMVLLAPVSARAAAVVVMRAFPPARPEGMGAATRTGATPAVIAAGVLIAGVTAFVALGPVGLAATGIAVACGMAAAAWIAGRMGGLTGDGYGAVIELTETAALCATAAFFANGHGHAWVWR
ncbi:MAG: adenosylcobinamide-GDP ribazoletransferase [Dehalococcoidia bacterium]